MIVLERLNHYQVHNYFGGITLTGAKAGNYTLSAATASDNVGEITQRAITVTAEKALRDAEEAYTPDPTMTGEE